MNMLDKLFSRELERRTGAHAVSIYIESVERSKKRTRSLGRKAMKASTPQKPKSTTKIITRHSSGSLFHRLNVRFPLLKFFAICFIGLIATLDLTGFTISGASDPSNKIRIAPMARHIKATERIIEGKKLAALTFDDGPSPETTPRLLDILREKDAPSTFFTLGNMARSSPDIIKRAAKEGHEIASHTMYHQNLVRIPASAVVADINEAKATFKNILGREPNFIRPPYGNYNNVVSTTSGVPLILWSVDTEDWRSKNPDAILSTAMSEVHDGAIILMHDIYPTTVEAVSPLIDTLRAQGYELVTIPELIRARKATPTNGTAYYNFPP